MDSGNTSGSIQSSSGGDEEYDSRAAASDSIFFTTNNNPLQNDIVRQHQHQQQQTQSNTSSLLFDPLSNFFDRNTTLDYNTTNMVWPRPVRSDPAPSDLMPSSAQVVTQPFLANNGQLGQTTPTRALGSNFRPSNIPIPAPIAAAGGSSEPGSSASAATSVGRNPKKRSRASRRAPTTVLTTDTTNFRAMVQEFTGIPAPPFAASPSFPRTRFDLFGSGSALRPVHALDHLASSSSSNSPTTISTATTAASPYNLLRPYAQKVQQTTPFVPNAPASNPINYGTLLNQNPASNNPVLSFNSLLQAPAPAKFPLLSPKRATSLLEDHRTTSFGLGHVSHLSPHGGLPNLVMTRNNVVVGNNQTTATATTAEPANWGGADVGVLASNDDNNNNTSNGNDNITSATDEGFLLRPINGGYGSSTSSERQLVQVVTNGKLSTARMAPTELSGSNSNKGTKINVAARSEGMVESWICSSD